MVGRVRRHARTVRVDEVWNSPCRPSSAWRTHHLPSGLAVSHVLVGAEVPHVRFAGLARDGEKNAGRDGAPALRDLHVRRPRRSRLGPRPRPPLGLLRGLQRSVGLPDQVPEQDVDGRDPVSGAHGRVPRDNISTAGVARPRSRRNRWGTRGAGTHGPPPRRARTSSATPCRPGATNRAARRSLPALSARVLGCSGARVLGCSGAAPSAARSS